MDIKIRNISPQVISEIDKIAKQEGVSQNTLYNKSFLTMSNAMTIFL